MSKVNRGRSSARLGQRMEFSFSSFCAVQVPLVSDRLLITIISVDSGKTIAKSSKAAALSGICQWPDSILQAIRFSRDEVSQEFQERQCKIVVSMGSTKTAILGEVFLNLTNYLSSSDSTAISLPLKRCNSGTVLQLTIQCLGAKKSSGKAWGELSACIADSSPTSEEKDKKSDVFYNIVNKTARSLSEDHLEGAYQDESGNMDVSFSAPKPRRSSNSGDRKNLSPRDNSNDGLHKGRQDAASSYVDHNNMNHGDDSSKDLLDTTEETIKELHDKAKMWERHSRKLKIEREALKNECANKSKEQAELALELSASHSEHDSLRQEIEELKSTLQDVIARQTIVGTPKFGDVIVFQKETIDEVQFLKESNANLTSQLSKTQEANIELVYILQELEETIELQRLEMSKLPQASDVVDHEVPKSELTVQEAAEWARILSLKEEEITMLREKLNGMLSVQNADGAGPDTIYLEMEKENEYLKVKIQELENEFSGLTDENLELIYKLKEVSGVAKGEDPCISSGEEMLIAGRSTSEVEHPETECADLELNLRSEFSGLEEKFQKSQDELKERTLELSELREKLLHATELELNLLNLRSEFSGLKEKYQESEDELKERTLELSELREKLLHATELELNLLNLRSEFSELEEKFQKSQDELKERTFELSELREKLLHATELEGAGAGADTGSSKHDTLRSGEPDDTETDLDVLKRTVLLKEEEINGLQHCIREMENNISDIQKEKSQLEERLAASLEESSMTSKCLDEAREDPLVLTNSVDSHVSANKVLEAKISELVHTVLLKEQDIDGFHLCKREMENTISDIQKEKSQLEERLAASLEESSMTSKCLDEVREDLVMLTSSVDSHVSTNKKEKSQLEERLAASLEESSMTSKCLDELRQDLLMLTSSVDSHVSTNKVLEAKISELVHTVLLKEQDIDGFHHCKREMENTISDIQKENGHLEERLAASLEENSMTSKCLDEAREDILVLTSSVDSHVSANKVLEAKISELVHTVMLKEQDIDGFHHCKREMENTISDIQKEKDQLEERLAASHEESSMTSKCLDEVREDLLVLTSSVDSHVSSNKVLETKISDLESRKFELESLVSKLEYENIELSQFISELEAQLTSLASENESVKLQMDDSILLMTSINDLVEQQQAEMEAAKLELKQRHLESQIRLSEVQEDSEALRRSNAKLQATIESVTEECTSLQTLTVGLKKQKMELHGHCAQLEQELDQSKRKTADLFNTVEFLEAKISTLQKDITLKEQSLLSELENIFQEHKEHEERINRAHFLLNKIENEKIVEVKNLERVVMTLTAQLSSTDGERESNALDSILEVSTLRADKAKLEANLQDVNAQMIHYESQLEDLRAESKSKIKGLTDSLNASKQNEETLTMDVEHIRRLMEAARSNEENLRKTSDELELKYKSSDYENQQVMEEISGLKIQVSKMASIHDEVSKLQNSLDQAKFEKKKLEELLQSLSEECEELKVQNLRTDELELKYKSSDNEKQQVMEEISGLKIQVRKMASIQDEVSKLQNSLDQAKSEKEKLEELLQSLSEECEELKAKSEKEKLEELLQSLSEECEELKVQNLRKTSDELELKYKSSDYENQQVMEEISGLKIQVSKMASIQDEVSKLQNSLDQAKSEKEKLEELLTSHDADEENGGKSVQAKLVIDQGNDDSANDNGGTPIHEDPDIQSKIHLLEIRLAEALEQNKLYKAQLQSPTGEGQSGSRDEKDNKDANRVAHLESELKDLQDRLLTVSLQYAEVAAQREELVMELKNATSKKGRWTDVVDVGGYRNLQTTTVQATTIRTYHLGCPTTLTSNRLLVFASIRSASFSLNFVGSYDDTDYSSLYTEPT
uniref:Uncharacterized protein n=1 Tax=Avena sativa TaxID=4498 RepID=A0ACD5TIN7_AVESA